MTPPLGWFGGHIEVTDLVLIVAVGVYLVDRAVDALGWSRTSRTLRSENTDLVRRNNELEEKVARMDAQLADQAVQIKAMEVRIVELQARDQAAVIQRLDNHETQANQRHEATIMVLDRIAEVLQHPPKKEET